MVIKLFRRNIQAGRRVEWWYGLAYHDWEMDCAYYYPIPLNFIVRYAKTFRIFWDRFRGNSSWIDKQIVAGIARHWLEAEKCTEQMRANRRKEV